MAQYIFHSADSRGNANHGWLHSRHTFSFANYYDQDRIQFGALRVLNDDYVAAGMGFGSHPHNNMEIISIPLEGDLEHKDSMGNAEVIRSGDVQVMSAGTGVSHSEYNKNKDKAVKFLQIWVIPKERNVKPRYDQITLNKEDRKNRFQQIISPDPSDEGMWMHQDAWFNVGDFEAGKSETYTLHSKDNGLYVFVLKGNITVDDKALSDRDGLGILDTESVQFSASSDAEVLLMEVPMHV